MSSKHGAVAVVTGAAAGIGQAFALRLAEDGADVAILDIAGADETVAQIKERGRRALGVLCDVSDPESVEAAAAAVSSEFGPATILVNTAGIYPHQSFASVTFADWRRVLSVNLDSMFIVCNAFLPGMLDAGSGRIVNVSSAAVGTTGPGFVPYITSKMGVIGFTRALANDLGDDNITVNAIAPGLIRTQRAEEMWKGTPVFEIAPQEQVIKRAGEPDDLVGAVSFLTSDDAAFITGQTLVVDGGRVRM